MTTCLPAASAASTNCKAGWVPPIVSMMMSTSGSSITRDTSVVSRTPSSRTSRGLSRLRTAAQVQRDSSAGAAGDPVGVVRQQPRDPGSHGPQADHADCDVIHVDTKPFA